jgi:hypothetical protein
VRLQVGQLEQRGRGHALLPARIDEFDRHCHRFEQGRHVFLAQCGRLCRRHVAAQAQGDLGLDQPQLTGPAPGVGRTGPHALRRQRGMGWHAVGPRVAGLPVQRQLRPQFAQAAMHDVLHGEGIGRIAQCAGEWGRVTRDANAARGEQRLGDRMDVWCSHVQTSSGQRLAQG